MSKLLQLHQQLTIDAGVDRIIGTSKFERILLVHSAPMPSSCRIRNARQASSGEEDPDMSDVLADLRIKARDNGRLPVPVSGSEALGNISSNDFFRNSSGMQKLCMQVSRRLQTVLGW